MHDIALDGMDLKILRLLQQDGALTNGALAEQVHLSASQCSRRRRLLEEAGFITGYSAQLNNEKLGFGVRAMIRVTLKSHGQDNENSFARFVQSKQRVRAAYSVSGDADYVLDVSAVDIADFADFVHAELLPNPLVAQVRSEIVLKTLKDESGVPV